ncbi:beta-N-acetylhexosaminidase [Promicromonospora sp. Populi]|uniref:beta-N-acetylhexosaminidase n=1 Tax=Promicromonospora sp. Populi TaxID=3239420 RepID=UPI0034E1B096
MLSYDSSAGSSPGSADADDAAARYATLLPTPSRVLPGSGSLDVGAGLEVRAEGPDARELEHRATRVVARLGLAAGAARSGTPVPLVLRTAGGASCGYVLDVSPDAVTITATVVEHAVHALTTLTQLLPPSALRADGLPAGPVHLPVGRVEDSPRYGWRGAMLDVVRHYAPPRTVLRYVDLLALHKFNRLHLHLTDDQGWRINSERFPRLAEVGGWRPSTRLGPTGEPDHTPHGGVYSLADLAEIVRYARERGIDVVPEIDVPGHTSALRAAYPELGQPGVEHTVQDTVWAGGSSIRPTRDVAAFLVEVLDELVEATGVRYVHLGGDECDMSWWAGDPQVAAEMAEHGYTEPKQMHGHLLRTLAAHLAGRGVRAVVWDEGLLTGGVLPDTVVMAWRGEKASARAARTHDVVRAPLFPTYFNFDQSDDPAEPRSEGGPVTIADVAAFAPVPDDWDDTQRDHVLGGQFQIWSEWVPDERRIDYLAFPRACALAQVLWSGPVGDLDALTTRIAAHLPRLDALGVAYRPLAGPHSWQTGGEGVWRRTASGTINQTRAWVESISDEP